MRKKYRVWRVVIRVFDHSMAIRVLHDTDNLQDIREYYQRVYRNKQPIRLYYTES